MSTYEELPAQFQLLPPLAEMVIRRMCGTGRCYLRELAHAELQPLLWDDANPWQFRLALRREADRWLAEGVLIRGEDRMDLTQPLLLLDGGFVFTRERVALLDAGGAFPWIAPLVRTGRIEALEGDQDALLAELLNHPQSPPLDVPAELSYEEVVESPKPRLQIARDKTGWRRDAEKLHGQLSFQYQKEIVDPGDPRRGVYHPAERKFIIRDRAAETAAASRMQEAGFRYKAPTWAQTKPVWELAPTKLPKVVLDLVPAGWEVHAEGNLIRRPGASRLNLSSGIDWFELRGEIDYGGAQATLPDLLKALRRGETMVKLDDGTYGMLPEDWLSRFGALPGLGSEEKDHIRFRKNQAGLLDAFLAARGDVTFDETFRRAREHLQSFEGIRTAQQPEEFVGQLRGYQLEGLGWMHFLREFGFGGCLADDMGVGKTAQVLALLQTRRGKSDGPSLIVVPKSLVFNWKQEAERFTPNLRILDHTGMGRDAARFENHDVVLTTYGTLRRDVTDFKDIVFDYVVLDEAQAIKNADTESAKAARLLNANNRLVLSGTPVENHLGELWSLFEFLNPGMLGTASVFKLASGAMRNPEEETRLLLAKAVRPFILRRTKGQVAKELPEKSEQTLYCEMEPAQRKLYDDLRDHYRASLLGRIESVGLAKSKMHVLEALLRLRQAACHPGLVDPGRTGEPSAKLDILLMQLSEVLEENHKVLVFSQFTSFLAILKERLDEQGIVYEYLDGKTRDRQARVERFQTDPDCKLFLISLKAGGLGLNLTAAEYVFLLDPWWNPAVEAQAIDRAHRIGQSRQVFAYRLIARGTVEEKVLELQKTKRNLADAIIGADNSIIRTLAREDLELLLS
jgi:hypothetical protein